MALVTHIKWCVMLIAALSAGCAAKQAGTSDGRLATMGRMPVTAPDTAGITAQWFGVSTLLIKDGATSIMIDGFFSRPDRKSLLFSKLQPDGVRIADALRDGKVGKVDALLVSHSHFDHAMDAPAVAIKTKALLVGSASTIRIARVAGMKERLCAVKDGDKLKVGRFEIEIFETPHAPTVIKGAIPDSFEQPAHFLAYKLGANYSFLLRHPLGNVLVVPSANHRAGMFKGVQAETVFLGIGRLGKSKTDFIRAYWNEAVDKTSAKLVIPVHWDDFTQPFVEPVPAPNLLVDNVDHALEMLDELAQSGRTHPLVRLMPPYQPVLLAAGAPEIVGTSGAHAACERRPDGPVNAGVRGAAMPATLTRR